MESLAVLKHRARAGAWPSKLGAFSDFATRGPHCALHPTNHAAGCLGGRLWLLPPPFLHCTMRSLGSSWLIHHCLPNPYPRSVVAGWDRQVMGPLLSSPAPPGHPKNSPQNQGFPGWQGAGVQPEELPASGVCQPGPKDPENSLEAGSGNSISEPSNVRFPGRSWSRWWSQTVRVGDANLKVAVAARV